MQTTWCHRNIVSNKLRCIYCRPGVLYYLRSGSGRPKTSFFFFISSKSRILIGTNISQGCAANVTLCKQFELCEYGSAEVLTYLRFHFHTFSFLLSHFWVLVLTLSAAHFDIFPLGLWHFFLGRPVGLFPLYLLRLWRHSLFHFHIYLLPLWHLILVAFTLYAFHSHIFPVWVWHLPSCFGTKIWHFKIVRGVSGLVRF